LAVTTLAEYLSTQHAVPGHAPWPRVLVDESAWRIALGALASGRWSLLDLWGEPGTIHMALLDSALPDPPAIGVVSLAAPDGRYQSVAQFHPPALYLERALCDLWGLQPIGLPDARPWIDHGAWDLQHLTGAASIAPDTPYPFLPAEGEGLHQVAVGPVHAGIIEPGHFRFTANGETVVRLELRLGYVHKGIESLLAGAPLDRAARIAGRTSGDCTVAYQFAFARAVEAALEIAVPPRAVYLRALMAELERLANHLGDIGAICNDASFALMHAHCGVLREQVLRAAGVAFGHRLMRDAICPGGVAGDLTEAAAAAIRTAIAEIHRRFPALVELYDNTASLQDRTVSTGILRPELARRYAAGGYVGRASGRDFDVRRAFPYPPYESLAFETSLHNDGDVNARVWVRIREVEQSLALVARILNDLPGGPLNIEPPSADGPREGMALVEGFRGDVLVWLRLDGQGNVVRCRLRDPSWFQWPLLEAIVEGNIIADFPICNKSFNCSYSGHDL
jgi:Ni,Fe-hydrogenase III large subunit